MPGVSSECACGGAGGLGDGLRRTRPNAALCAFLLLSISFTTACCYATPSLAAGKNAIASSYYVTPTLKYFPVRYANFNASLWSSVCRYDATVVYPNSYGIYSASGADTRPWYQVDLGGEYVISDVQLGRAPTAAANVEA
jgi:hypothetical protein